MAEIKDKGGKSPPPTEPPVKTGGSGGEGDENSTQHAEQPTGMVLGDERDPVVKARIDLVTAGEEEESRLPEGYEFSFTPSSLMGSWFHKLEGDEIIWQGVIVAELGGVYLCQVQKLEEGCEDVQILVPFPEMQDSDYCWRFYDSEAKALAAYQRWNLER